jgi:hypothetical protein
MDFPRSVSFLNLSQWRENPVTIQTDVLLIAEATPASPGINLDKFGKSK